MPPFFKYKQLIGNPKLIQGGFILIGIYNFNDLNFLIGKVDTYQQNIRFNTDEEGSLKLNISEAITKK